MYIYSLGDNPRLGHSVTTDPRNCPEPQLRNYKFQLDRRFSNLKSQSMLSFAVSLLPRSVEKRPGNWDWRLRLSIHFVQRVPFRYPSSYFYLPSVGHLRAMVRSTGRAVASKPHPKNILKRPQKWFYQGENHFFYFNSLNCLFKIKCFIHQFGPKNLFLVLFCFASESIPFLPLTIQRQGRV